MGISGGIFNVFECKNGGERGIRKPNITNNSVQKVQGVLSGVVNQQIFDIIEVWDTLSSEVQHTLCQLALKGKGGSYK